MGAFVLWVPVRVAIWLVRDEDRGLFSGHSPALRPGQILGHLVSDRGVGFHPGDARASGGLGLVSMRERVRLVRGALAVQSQPNQGTTLTVEIPLTGRALKAGSAFRF